MTKFKSNVPLVTLRHIQSNFPKAKINSSADSAEFIKQFYGDDISIFESFFILMLNRANTTVGYAKISQGGISGTVVDVRIIAKYAVDTLCSSVILAHNHPSGNTTPSSCDIDITRKTKNALELLDIKVIDHVILTETDGYFSFADDGLLLY
jgi:DNA repair protein RadC